MSKDNLTYDGHVKDASKPVGGGGRYMGNAGTNYDAINDRVIDPNLSIYDNIDYGDDEEVDEEYERHASNGLSLIIGIPLAILFGPVVTAYIITAIVDCLVPVFEFLFIPSIIVVLASTTFLSKSKRFIRTKILEDSMNKLILHIVNIGCGFSIVYVLTQNESLRWIENIERTTSYGNTFGTTFVHVTYLVVLYSLRIIIPAIIIPLIQRIIWKIIK